MPADYCAPVPFARATHADWHDGPDDNPLHREGARRFAQFAQQVRATRKALGWNQARLADEVGVSERTIRDLETGASFQSGWSLMRVAAILQLDMAVARDWNAGKPRGRDDLERHGRRPRPARGRIGR